MKNISSKELWENYKECMKVIDYYYNNLQSLPAFDLMRGIFLEKIWSQCDAELQTMNMYDFDTEEITDNIITIKEMVGDELETLYDVLNRPSIEFLWNSNKQKQNINNK